MARTIKLNMAGFEKEISKFSSDAKNLTSVKASMSKQGSRMSGIDRMEECTREYNKVMRSLNNLLDRDAQAMRDMKSKLVQADTAVAAKVFGGRKR